MLPSLFLPLKVLEIYLTLDGTGTFLQMRLRKISHVESIKEGELDEKDIRWRVLIFGKWVEKN
jgi:hypothetical protein